MLKLSGIEKAFPGVKALSSVDFDVRGGEIHALVGENGAGKSTLTKIIGGAYVPNAGTLEFSGRPVKWTGPAEARNAGIHVIYQEFVLFPNLSVAENITKGNERTGRFGLIDHAANRRVAAEVIARLGVRIDVNDKVANLSVADQQMVEIAKALVRDVKLLILDEPTAVLSENEVTLLFGVVRSLRDSGVGIVYISHRLDEIFDLCDRVTVLKDGQRVATRQVTQTSHEQLVKLMVGRDLANYFPPKAATIDRTRPPALAIDGVTVPGRVNGASISVQPGEILGIAGLIGAGRTELALAAYGMLARTAGSVSVSGRAISPTSPRTMIAAGVGFVTEDRKGQGMFMNLDVARNVTGATLSAFTRNGLVSSSTEQAAAEEEIARFAIACRGPMGPVDTLSGGNQQKIIFGRWTRACHTALILDEPTRGVDVGAKAEIYRIIRELAARGIGIVMISSELQEVIGMADRVAVMRAGAISGELSGDEITEENIMRLAAHTGKLVA